MFTRMSLNNKEMTPQICGEAKEVNCSSPEICNGEG